MPLGEPKDLTDCQRFFLEPDTPKQRMYEALRQFFIEGRPSYEVAAAFGYTPGSFRVLCHQFRRDPDPQFFAVSQHGPSQQPKKTAARDIIEQLRKQNYSVYEISEVLKQRKTPLSPTAVREVLKEMGFAPLPRRLDEERPEYPRPTIEPVADVRKFDIFPRSFSTRCGGLFLFIPYLIELGLDKVVRKVRLPGSKMIPATHALRASLMTKLWSIERKSHVMSLVTDEGLALFCGLNCIPKKSYLLEYSSWFDSSKTTKLLAEWHRHSTVKGLFPGQSFDLDFHSVPYYGEHPNVEKNYVSSRSRSQPSVLVLLARDSEGRSFCYSNADIRKGEGPDQVFNFIKFWKRVRGEKPKHLVFDSRLTTQENLARLDRMEITFITLRRRSPKILKEIEDLPLSAWRRLKLDVPTRKYCRPRVYEQSVEMAGRKLRQIYVLDLGHDKPTVLLTNETRTATQVITRYAQRMIIENAISDAVRFFHMDALSSAVGLKVDFDMALLVIANSLYRLLAKTMRGYSDSQARQIFRDLIDMPADVNITDDEVIVRFHRRAHLPIIIGSGLLDRPVSVPWWLGLPLRLTT